MRKHLWSVLMMVLLGATTAQAGFLADLPPVTPDGNADRASIPDVYKWDLTALYPDPESWAAAMSAARAELEAIAKLHGSLGDPSKLADYLGRYYDLELAGNRVTLYAYLGTVPDTTDQVWLARHQQALGLTNDIMAEGTVLREAVLGLSDAALAEAYAKVDGFDRFRPAIEALRRRADRVLGPEAERVLSLAGDNLWAAIDINELPSPLEKTFNAVIAEMPLPTVTDADGKEVQLTFANYPSLRASEDRRVREEAVHGMFSALKAFENTFAATLGGQAQTDVLFARARNYETAMEAYLDKDDLDPAVYRNLIVTVRAHAPALHRYVELRKKALGLDAVHLYDLYIPLVEGVEKKMNYAEGADFILTALAPLGADYQEAVRWLLDPSTGAVDVYPSRHKDSGASSSSVYGVHPYLKMNFLNRLDDVSTLAHELGHAVHTQLTNTNQPYLTSRYTMVLAEVASTCNEMLLSQVPARQQRLRRRAGVAAVRAGRGDPPDHLPPDPVRRVRAGGPRARRGRRADHRRPPQLDLRRPDPRLLRPGLHHRIPATASSGPTSRTSTTSTTSTPTRSAWRRPSPSPSGCTQRSPAPPTPTSGCSRAVTPSRRSSC